MTEMERQQYAERIYKCETNEAAIELVDDLLYHGAHPPKPKPDATVPQCVPSESVKVAYQCPICGKGVGMLRTEPMIIEFREQLHNIFSYFYKCNKCKEEFTTDKVDEITLNQVYSKYRKATQEGPF